jgi:thiosulfate/3-mercaptopyruvate sulfurtransferase
MYTTLISAEQLKNLQASEQPLMVFDCSFELMKPEMADIMFSTERIQGAQQAHLGARGAAAPVVQRRRRR